MNKKKIEGLIICLGNLTIKDLVYYTKLSEKEVKKHVDKLIKENKVEYT